MVMARNGLKELMGFTIWTRSGVIEGMMGKTNHLVWVRRSPKIESV
jgi:hypothetical protein